MTREEIVRDALTWEGTPFRHQARIRGHGGDCIAMVEWIALKYGVIDKPYRTNYGPEPMMREIIESLRSAGMIRLRSIADRLPGDVLFIQYRHQPQHLAIDIGEGRLIHGYSEVGKYTVSRVNGRLLDGIRSVWQFPGVAS